MLCLRPSSQISYELPSQLIFSDTFRHTERLFVFTWGCEVVIRDGAALPHSLCRLQRVTWPGRCGGGVCFLYGRWTGLSSSLCCESAQCWILTMFPLCSVRLHAEKLHLFVFSLHSHSLCVRLRVRVCVCARACVCVCVHVCLCVCPLQVAQSQNKVYLSADSLVLNLQDKENFRWVWTQFLSTVTFRSSWFHKSAQFKFTKSRFNIRFGTVQFWICQFTVPVFPEY